MLPLKILIFIKDNYKNTTFTNNYKKNELLINWLHNFKLTEI